MIPEHEDGLPRRKHLRRLDHVHVYSPVCFITVTALGRQRVLVPLLGDAIGAVLMEAGQLNEWSVGRFVLMPDHLHFFAAAQSDKRSLSRFLGGLKELSTRAAWGRGWQGKLWQRECFDRLLRSEESYADKWEYVRNNPVRAGLVKSSDDWPCQGELGMLAIC